MVNLTQDLRLEDRIFEVLGLGDGTTPLSRAKQAIKELKLAQFVHDSDISRVLGSIGPINKVITRSDVLDYMSGYDTLSDDTTYTLGISFDALRNSITTEQLLETFNPDYKGPPERGNMFTRSYNHGSDNSKEERAVQAALKEFKSRYDSFSRSIANHNLGVTEKFDDERRRTDQSLGPSKASLYVTIDGLLNEAETTPVERFRGSQYAPQANAFTSPNRDVGEARFIKGYLEFKMHVETYGPQGAADILDGMLQRIDESRIPELRQLRNDVLLEQARVFFDIEQYELAVGRANKVDPSDRKATAQASLLKADSYIKLREYSSAAREFRTAYENDRSVVDIDNRVLDVFRFQIRSYQVDQAVADLEEFFKLPGIAESQERKNRVILQEARTLMEAGPEHYELAGRLSRKVDESAYADASQLRGEIGMKMATISTQVGELFAADQELRNAYSINPDLDGLVEKIATVNKAIGTTLSNPHYNASNIRTVDVGEGQDKQTVSIADLYDEAATKYANGPVEDRDGQKGAKTIFQEILTHFGYDPEAVTAEVASGMFVQIDESQVKRHPAAVNLRALVDNFAEQFDIHLEDPTKERGEELLSQYALIQREVVDGFNDGLHISDEQTQGAVLSFIGDYSGHTISRILTAEVESAAERLKDQYGIDISRDDMTPEVIAARIGDVETKINEELTRLDNLQITIDNLADKADRTEEETETYQSSVRVKEVVEERADTAMNLHTDLGTVYNSMMGGSAIELAAKRLRNLYGIDISEEGVTDEIIADRISVVEESINQNLTKLDNLQITIDKLDGKADRTVEENKTYESSVRVKNMLEKRVDADMDLHTDLGTAYNGMTGGEVYTGLVSRLTRGIAARRDYLTSQVRENLETLRQAADTLDAYVADYNQKAVEEARLREKPKNVMDQTRAAVGPRIQGLNRDESLLLAETLHHLSNIQMSESQDAPDLETKRRLLYNTIGFDRNNPANVGLIGQAMAISQYGTAHDFLVFGLGKLPHRSYSPGGNI